MKIKKNFIIIGLFVVSILIVSCELGFDVPKPNIYMISMGCDFGTSGKNLTKAVDKYGNPYTPASGFAWGYLGYTVNDAVEAGKGFEALAKKAKYNFKIQYLLGPDTQNSDANYSYDELGKFVVGEPSFENFEKALTSFSDIKSSDILIFFVSSHGGSAEYDSQACFRDDVLAFVDCSVSFAYIKSLLKSTGATVVFMADTCHSGTLVPPDNGVVINPDVSNKKPISILFNSKIRETAMFYSLTACTYDEVSWEEEYREDHTSKANRIAYGHGFFTRGLLNAISWNDKSKSLNQNINAMKYNKVTFMGICQHIYENVSRDVVVWQNDFQRPAQHAQAYQGTDDIILFKF